MEVSRCDGEEQVLQEETLRLLLRSASRMAVMLLEAASGGAMAVRVVELVGMVKSKGDVEIQRLYQLKCMLNQLETMNMLRLSSSSSIAPETFLLIHNTKPTR